MTIVKRRFSLKCFLGNHTWKNYIDPVYPSYPNRVCSVCGKRQERYDGGYSDKKKWRNMVG